MGMSEFSGMSLRFLERAARWLARMIAVERLSCALQVQLIRSTGRPPVDAQVWKAPRPRPDIIRAPRRGRRR
jgi:hypothetical protein